MNIPPEHLQRLGAVLEAGTESFTELASLGGLDPAKSFRGADLRHVDFATDDLSGYDFSGADLTGANLAHARTSGLIWDARTIWPSGWLPPPCWADDWGSDQYGRWASFTLAGADGSHVTQRLRWIPPGDFLMGSPAEEEGRWADEGPQHRVVFAHGFWMFETTCTEELWEVVTGTKPRRCRGLAFPITEVSWDDVQAFLAKLNTKRPGLALSVPSEAQWEYACRGGTTTRYHFGHDIDPALVCYDSKAPVPVGSLPPNTWGLREMHGNVWEWCADAWHDSYEGAPADGAVWDAGSSEAREHVLRGGSFKRLARFVRAAYRFRDAPSVRSDHLGFRCARVQAATPSRAVKRRAGSGKQAKRSVAAAASLVR
jgi:formylglycine-generating enzyme required for sulfatase activity